MSASTARTVATELLLAVERHDAYANLLLPRLLARSGLARRDRALATELGYGTLRTQGSLDHAIAGCSRRPVAELDPPVRAALRLAAYQLLHTRIGAHAAVSSAVDAVTASRGRGAGGFTNAVLRCLARRAAGPDPLGLAEVSDPAARLALASAHPGWIVAAFAAAFGEDLAGPLTETTAACQADNVRPLTHLVARPGRISRDELLAAAGPGATAGVLSPYAVHLSGGDPAELAAVRDGRAGVQDEGSQLMALALHEAAPPGLLVDLCAGPGGKGALLAALRPGQLLALEPAAHRAALVRRTGVAALAQADGRCPPVRPGSVAGVLVDAPCTGLGALRRRPEARWRRQPEELAGLVSLQRDLVASAVRLVRPGGVIAYCVCSPHLAEAQLDPPAGSELLGGATARRQLWPHRDGTDAMALTLLRVTG